MTKTCSRCRKVLPVSEFHKSRGEIRNSRCRACVREYQKEWRAKHRAEGTAARFLAENPGALVTCIVCGELKLPEEFSKDRARRDGLSSFCKLCKNDAKSRYRRTSYYGITENEYRAIVDAHGNVCGICREPCTSGRRLAIDHDHSCCPGDRSCGECVRGLLCIRCNNALGHFRDDPGLLTRAIEYLREKPAQAVLAKKREAA